MEIMNSMTLYIPTNTGNFEKGQNLMSNAIIAKANLKKFEVDFLTKVQQAALEDANWVYRKEELEEREKEGKCHER